MKQVLDLVCDDRVDELKLTEDIKKMTDEEFERFAQMVKETNELPAKYYN